MNNSFNHNYQIRSPRILECLKFQKKPELYQRGQMADIVTLKKYYGLSRSGKIILLPVFDEICFSDNGDIAFARISLYAANIDSTNTIAMIIDGNNTLNIFCVYLLCVLDYTIRSSEQQAFISLLLCRLQPAVVQRRIPVRSVGLLLPAL